MTCSRYCLAHGQTVRPPTEGSSPRLAFRPGTETLMAKADTVGLTNASKLNYRGGARESRISTGHGRDTGKFLKSVRHQYIIGARLEQQNSSRSRPQNWSRVSPTDLKRAGCTPSRTRRTTPGAHLAVCHCSSIWMKQYPGNNGGRTSILRPWDRRHSRNLGRYVEKPAKLR